MTPKQLLRATKRLETLSCPEPMTGCLLWTGYRIPCGYGEYGYSKTERILTHRLAWQIANGPIPEGLCVLHKCDTRAYVNPDHLFVGTRQDNVADMMAKGRVARGEAKRSARLTEADVRRIRTLHRLGVPRRLLAAHYAMSWDTISDIVSGRRWAHVPLGASLLELQAEHRNDRQTERPGARRED